MKIEYASNTQAKKLFALLEEHAKVIKYLEYIDFFRMVLQHILLERSILFMVLPNYHESDGSLTNGEIS